MSDRDESKNSVTIESGDEVFTGRVDLTSSEWIEVTEKGLEYCKAKIEQNIAGEAPVTRVRITRQAFAVSAYTVPVDPNGAHGIEVTYRTVDGDIDRRVISRGLIHEPANKLEKFIADRGIRLDPKFASMVKRYMALVEPAKRVVAYEQTGWQTAPSGKLVFVLGDVGVLGANDGVFQTGNSTPLGNLSKRGELDEWIEKVCRPACVLPLWRFAIMAALSGPLLKPLGEPNHGIHVVGQTSTGKTLSAKCGASTYGRAETTGRNPFMSKWRATANGMEGMAEAYCDLFLVLDELAEADGRHVGDIIYMLNDGVGKTRMTDNTAMRRRKMWRLMVYSTGEQGLESKVHEAGKRYAGGMSVRMVEIRTDNTVLLQSVPAAELKQLESAIRDYYGTAGEAFIRRLLVEGYGDTQSDVVKQLKARVNEIEARLVADDNDDTRRRATRTFAIIQAAGELAVQFGILPPEIKPEDTCKQVHAVWRDGPGQRDTSDFLMAAQKLLALIDEKINSTIIRLDGSLNGEAERNNRERQGWYQSGDDETDPLIVYLLPATIEKTLNGYSTDTFLKQAAECEVLLAADGDNFAPKVPRIPGYRPRAYGFHYNKLQNLCYPPEPGRAGEESTPGPETSTASSTSLPTAVVNSSTSAVTGTTLTRPPCYGNQLNGLLRCRMCPFEADCQRSTSTDKSQDDKLRFHEGISAEAVRWAETAYPDMCELFTAAGME